MLSDLIAIAILFAVMWGICIFADMCAIADAQRKHTYSRHSRERGNPGRGS